MRTITLSRLMVATFTLTLVTPLRSVIGLVIRLIINTVNYIKDILPISARLGVDLRVS